MKSKFMIFVIFITSTFFSCATVSGGRYSSRPAKNENLALTMAGFQIDSGKLIYAFGGNFLKPAIKFTVIDVSNPEKPEVIMDINKPIPIGMKIFNSPASPEFLKSSGDSKMDYDVIIVDINGNQSILKQGTGYSAASKKTLNLVLESSK